MQIALLPMQWQRIVEPCLYALSLKVRRQRVSVFGANYVEVIDRTAPLWFERNELVTVLDDLRENGVVALRRQPTLFRPSIEVAQFDSKKRRLHRIESTVVAFHIMVVLLRLS